MIVRYFYFQVLMAGFCIRFAKYIPILPEFDKRNDPTSSEQVLETENGLLQDVDTSL